MCGSSVNLKSHLAISFNQSYMRSHLATSLNQIKMCKKWSHCNGWPTQVERIWKTVSLWWVTYPNGKNVKCGLIIMGDLPGWKIEKNMKWSHCNGWPTQMENEKNMKWSHCNGWPTQVEDRKNMKWYHCYGWPTQVEDRKNVKWSHCYGWPTQVERMWSAVSL